MQVAVCLVVWEWVAWAVWDSNKFYHRCLLTYYLKTLAHLIIGEGFVLKMSIIFYLNLFLEQTYENPKKNHSAPIYSKFYNS